MTYDILLSGLPGRTSRGFLGWSTVILLHTEGGPVLFDTGAPGDRPGLLKALAARSIAPADIRTIILSHLHFDHTGNLDCFANAQVVLHQKEYGYFLDHGQTDPAMPLLLVKGLFAERTVQLVHGEIEPVGGVRMLLTPGHSGGHCSLEVTVDGARHILAQDALKSRHDLTDAEPTGAFDAVEARRSIDRIIAIADVIVPGHDVPLSRRGDVFVPGDPVACRVELAGKTEFCEMSL